MKPSDDNFKLNKNVTDAKRNRPIIRNKYQYLVWNFIEKAKYFSGNDWKKEIAVAKRLFEKNSDFSFWKSLDLGFNLNSLCWFETARGKEFLEQKNYLFKSTHVNFTKEKVKYEDKKLGEDRVSPKKKVKNILDLFKDEEKKRR